MTTSLSIQIDAVTKERLDAIARRSQRSASAVAEEALAQYLETELWQAREIEAGIADVDQGKVVEHEKVEIWLKGWGTPSEGDAP